MNRPIHIQHVLLSLQPGGLENGVVNVVNRLDRDRFRSSVTCLKDAGVFATRLRGPEIPVHAMGLQRGNDIGLPLRLARLFRRTRPDVVHTRNAEAFFYGLVAARLAGVRRVIHSEHGRLLPDTRRRMAAQRFLLRFTDAAFAVSEQLRRDLVSHLRVPGERFQVIHNGVDVARVSGADPARARSALGASGDELVVGSVGRLVPVKNYALLVRAFARAAASAPRPMRLVLIGDGPERAVIQAAAAAGGVAASTTLLGHREDVAELLAGLDAFVLPSLSEGMSNTLLEAMAAGVAVVASDVGGNREIVEDDRSGLLFRSGDEAALAHHLASLVAEPTRRARLAKAGHERVVREFSIGAMIRNYESLYEQVVR